MASQLKPPKPDLFYGDDKQPPYVRSWLFEVETYFGACLAEFTDLQKVKLAASFLRGNAQLWWQQHCHMADSATPVISWAAFRDAITAQFGGYDEVEKAIESLHYLKQGTSVSSYIHDWNEALLKIPAEQIIDPMMTNWFISGLKSSTQVHVRIAKPTTLKEAMTLADRIDRVQPTTLPTRHRTFDAPSSPKLEFSKSDNFGHHSFTNGAEPMMLGTMTAALTPAEKQYLYNNDGCFYCRKPHAGHASYNCPNKKKRNA